MASVAKRKRTNADGTNGDKWIVRYVDRSGAHRQKTFDRKKEADACRVKLESERAEHGYVDHIAAMTVERLASEYGRFEDQRLDDGRIKRSYHRQIVLALNASIVPRLGKMEIGALNVAAIETWYRALRSEDALAVGTARHRLLRLSVMLAFAKRRGLTKHNPAKEAMEALGRGPKDSIRIASADEVRALLTAAETKRTNQHASTWRLSQVALHLAAFCGLRSGEILALRLGDVDLAAREIRIAQTLNRWDQLTEPKTPSSKRTVPIPAHVVVLLRAWLADHYIPNDRTLIFRASVTRTGLTEGAPISTTSFRAAYWLPLCRAAGLHRNGEALHFHALRHFAASWWLQNRLPVPDVARLLGHRNANITLGIYAHAMLTDQQRVTAIDSMAQALLTQPLAQVAHTSPKAPQYQ